VPVARAALLAALAIAVAASGRADSRVVATLPAQGDVGLMHLYGMDFDGRAFDAPEGLRIGDGWDLVLFRAPRSPSEIAVMVVCNERIVTGDDGEPDLERSCSDMATKLPEPDAGAWLAGAGLIAVLSGRRRP